MKRAPFLVAAILASALFAISRDIEPAFACSGPGPVENLVHAQVILEGRVVSLEPTTGDDPSGQREPYLMTIEVARGHLGVSAGDRLTALAFLPGDFPIMCPQFSRDPDDTIGKYVVIGLYPPSPGDDRLQADAWAVPYTADDPGAAGYAEAVRLAEMISDSDPESARLTIDSGTVACGGVMRFTGERFSPGDYVLRPLFGPVLAVATAGLDGRFDVSLPVPDRLCRNAFANGELAGYHAYEVGALTGTDRDQLALREIASGRLQGATNRQPSWPELRVSPDPADCGDNLNIDGVGFEANERIHLRIGGEASPLVVMADANGAFQATSPIGPGTCDDPIIAISASQADFEQFLPGWWTLTNAYIARGDDAPSPPVAGTGLALVAQDRELPWNDVVMVIILMLAFSGGTLAIVRSSRRR